LLTDVVQKELKVAKVIPKLKKGDPSLPGNYRPISLLNIFGKLLEKLMYHYLSLFVHEVQKNEQIIQKQMEQCNRYSK